MAKKSRHEAQGETPGRQGRATCSRKDMRNSSVKLKGAHPHRPPSRLPRRQPGTHRALTGTSAGRSSRKQKTSGWGHAVIAHLGDDLQKAFPSR